MPRDSEQRCLRLLILGDGFDVAGTNAGARARESVEGDRESYTVPSTPGLYSLTWAINPTADEWQLLSEVLVGETVVFRKRKSNTSDWPQPNGWVYLQVMP